MQHDLEASLPSRGRGLKLQRRCGPDHQGESLPSRGRGLKYPVQCLRDIRILVAPFAGAWIEI